jgi:hypothetical protein
MTIGLLLYAPALEFSCQNTDSSLPSVELSVKLSCDEVSLDIDAYMVCEIASHKFLGLLPHLQPDYEAPSHNT